VGSGFGGLTGGRGRGGRDRDRDPLVGPWVGGVVGRGAWGSAECRVPAPAGGGVVRGRGRGGSQSQSVAVAVAGNAAR
jgi:hypothetical protein